MKWSPRIGKEYILTPTQYAVARYSVWVISAIMIIGEKKMFANIDNIYVAIACAFVTVFAWLAIVQYSRYRLDKHEDAPREENAPKFAVVPYLLIPLVWGAVAVGVGLYAVNLAAGHYTLSQEDIIFAGAVASVLVYAVLDLKVVSMTGDAKYFADLEREALKSSKAIVEEMIYSEEEKNLILALRANKKKD